MLVGRLRRETAVHGAHELSEAELSEGMRDARSFIDRFAKLVEPRFIAIEGRRA